MKGIFTLQLSHSYHFINGSNLFASYYPVTAYWIESFVIYQQSCIFFGSHTNSKCRYFSLSTKNQPNTHSIYVDMSYVCTRNQFTQFHYPITFGAIFTLYCKENLSIVDIIYIKV